jgi:ferric-dicitrate binding protein FerR (iron transport regulator)
MNMRDPQQPERAHLQSIIRFLGGEATKEERSALMQQLSEDKQFQQLFDEAKAIWQYMPQTKPLFTHTLEGLIQAIKNEDKKLGT